MYHPVQKSFFIVALAAMLFRASAVFAQWPVAKYPLEVEGQKTFRFYDVTGHGWHGTLVNRSVNPIDAIFRADSFYNGIACLRKLTADDAVVSLPAFYYKDNLTQNGFTLTLWVYVDAETDKTNSPASLVHVPAFDLLRVRDAAGKIHFGLQYPVKAYPGFQYYTDDLDFSRAGWYYLAVSYNPYGFSNSTVPTVTFASYYYYGQPYDPDVKALTHSLRYHGGQLSPDTNDSREGGSLLDGNFTGKLWNVSFYDRLLDDNEVNDDRNTSWYQTEKNARYFRSDHYYVVGGVHDFYPCEGSVKNGQVKDVIGGRNSFSVQDLSYVEDRFGAPGSAIRFGQNGYAGLPPFYLPFGNSSGFDVRKGYTLSFWTYIENYLFPPDNASVPFYPTDRAYQYIYLSTAAGVIGGVESIRDRLVLDRYVDRNPVTCWRMWLWDPASFENIKGWCHVVLSQKENAVRVMVFKPGASGEMGCRLNYFNAPDLAKQPASFGFGVSPNTIWKDWACPYLDDVRIYDWPFSQQEAAELHAYELSNK